MTMLVSEYLRRENNNLDIVRLVLAALVIYGHSFAVTPSAGQGRDLIRLVSGYDSGSLAIKGFFFLSGLLVANSLARDPSWLRYAINRFFRIWPALAVVTLFMALVIGPFISALSPASYLGADQTWTFVWRQLALAIWGGEPHGYYALPGVFASNPYPSSVNVPVWSLVAEVYAYGLLLAIALITRMSKPATLLIFALILIDSLLPDKFLFKWIPQENADLSLLPLSFAAGALVAAYRDVIKLSWIWPLCFLALGLLLGRGRAAEVLGYATWFSLMLLVSSLPIALKLKLPGDVDPSYGTFLWGWPIAQLYALAFPESSHALALFITLAIAVLIGALSNWGVERPLQHWGKSIARKFDGTDRPGPATTPSATRP